MSNATVAEWIPFSLVTALVAVKLVDLVSSKLKLEQTQARASRTALNGPQVRVVKGDFKGWGRLRRVRRAFREEARWALRCYAATERIAKSFTAIVMLTFLGVFAILGLCEILMPAPKPAYFSTLVTGSAGIFSTLISSLIGVPMEALRLIIDRNA